MEPSVAAGVAVVEALLSAGVQRIVLSPGSRSAPLARAVAALEASGVVDLSVRVDERSAGFLALGMAKAGTSPVAVMCTSGTAVANLMPAAVEARYAGVPLVIVTADRPPELRGRGASQTIDQVGFLDHVVVGSRDLAVPEDAEWSASPVVDLVQMAVRTRAPVHLNIPFRPPLVGALERSHSASPPGAITALAATSSSNSAAPDPEVTRRSAPALAGAARGAFLVGDLDVGDDGVRRWIHDVADECGWPIVAEASSGMLGQPGVVPGGTAMLSDPVRREQLRADLVVTVGPFGLDRGVLAWVRSAQRHVAIRLRPRTDPPDPLATAEVVVDHIPSLTAVTPDPSWRSAWNHDVPAPLLSWSPEAVAATVWRQMERDDLLVVASSTAVRALAAAARGPGPKVIANRGANGIDGLVSTAWGAADVCSGRTVALLGDLAFLHDTNGLLVPAAEPRPDLTFVVVDNNGGGIFASLEQGAAQYADTFERVFATPHDRDLVDILAAHQVPAGVVTDTDTLADALTGGSGVRAVVARLPRGQF